MSGESSGTPTLRSAAKHGARGDADAVGRTDAKGALERNQKLGRAGTATATRTRDQPAARTAKALHTRTHTTIYAKFPVLIAARTSSWTTPLE